MTLPSSERATFHSRLFRLLEDGAVGIGAKNEELKALYDLGERA